MTTCGVTKIFGREHSAEGQTVVECDLPDLHDGDHEGFFFPDYRVSWERRGLINPRHYRPVAQPR